MRNLQRGEIRMCGMKAYNVDIYLEAKEAFEKAEKTNISISALARCKGERGRKDPS